MTFEQTLIVAFAGFAGAVTAILTAFGIYIRANAGAIKTNSDAAGYADKARADGELLREKSSANVTDKLVEIAAASMKIQQDGLKIQEGGLKVQQDMADLARATAKSIDEHAAQMRGMVAMQDDHTKLLRTTAQSIDDVQSQVATISKVTTTLQTDIEGTLGGQYGAIVVALTGIGTQLSALALSSVDKDSDLKKSLTEIIEEFRLTHKQLMEKLEPIALRYIGDIAHEKHAENGNVSPVTPTAE